MLDVWRSTATVVGQNCFLFSSSAKAAKGPLSVSNCRQWIRFVAAGLTWRKSDLELRRPAHGRPQEWQRVTVQLCPLDHVRPIP